MSGSRTGSLGGSVEMGIRRLQERIEESGLATDAKASLVQDVKDVKEELVAHEAAYTKDKVFYRIVVTILGVAILMVVMAITYLLSKDIKGFDALTAIGSAAVGGLVGLLAPSPVGSK